MAGHIPEAWPALLTIEQLCAYLGDISAGTLAKVCPVPPVDWGANLVRYNRVQIDAWLGSLPSRLPRVKASGQDAPPLPETVDAAAIEPEDRRLASLDRARERIGRRPCRKPPSHTSSESHGRAAG